MGLSFAERTSSFSKSGSVNESVSFDGQTVVGAGVAIQGYNATYGPTVHHDDSTNKVEIHNISYSGSTVSYTVDFQYDDTANERSGSVTALIIAETA